MAVLKYTNDHECVKIEGDIAWVGITKYAQEALGDLVYVELPSVGKKVKKGEYFAVVESVKTAAEVYSPVDGEVIEANDNMPTDLEMIKSPVGEQGWIAKIKISDPAQLANLMDEAAYKKYLESL
ncbi:MAG TPA: glycine cleavage system protein GcvH [Alphaproteobacteria bacterium]|jgi:glycine cleavage system H protein|nr:glycine cleavage system protein GcvH [Micavibrio sp.]MBK9562067.1 glycine cleavage system protein GcvH [Micavibrio sp.]HQX27777.1 glycine cleavage system protein GcvH [Alphaproteobacteria bacterium]